MCVFENNKCGNDTLRYSDVCVSLRIINVEMTHLDIQVCVCVFENNKCGNDTLRYSGVCVCL